MPSPGPEPFGRRMGLLMLWLLVLVTPLLISPTAKEAFRLLKGMASGWLALASLFFFAWEVRQGGTIRWTDLWSRPAVRAVLPVLAVATASFAASSHPLHVREGLADLWIGAAALVGWSLALERGRLERLLLGLLVPASLLALLGIAPVPRDLPAPPVLGDQLRSAPRRHLARRQSRGSGGLSGPPRSDRPVGRVPAEGMDPRSWPRVALALCLYAMALTQTLAALAALAVGSALLWALLLPRRQAVLLFGGGAALALVLVLAVAPLRVRIAAKAGQALSGDWNSVLTGRLDGWRAALWMIREHPWTGVGHGAYRPEYVPAMNALLDRGVRMYPLHMQPVFANAHNEYLEAVAEWGLLGIVALAWGLWVLSAALRRAPGDGRAGAGLGGRGRARRPLDRLFSRSASPCWPSPRSSS